MELEFPSKALLKKFLNAHLHTEDSENVKKEFSSQLLNFRPAPGVKKPLSKTLGFFNRIRGTKTDTGIYTQDTIKPPSLPSVNYLKYISRRHGLPSELCPILSFFFQAPTGIIPFRMKFQIVQIFKYCLEKNHDYLSFSECLSFLNYLINTDESTWNALSLSEDEGRDYFTPFIASVLGQCIALKINPENRDSKVENSIRKYFDHFDAKTRAELLRNLEKWQHEKRGHPGSGDLEHDLLNLGRGQGPTYREHGMPGVFSTGRETMSKIQKGSASGQVNVNIKADAVRSQQVAVSSTKQNVSEKTEIESISLANALYTGRSKTTQQNLAAEVLPSKKKEEGSDRSWWRPPNHEFDFFVEKSNNKTVIKEDDIVWLRKNITSNFRAIVLLADSSKVAGIFARISEYQDISNSVLNDLSRKLFGSRKLDYSYESCRIKILTCFENQSQRVQGKMPKSLEDNLMTFKDKKQCTAEMRRRILRIFAPNDDKYLETFAMALDQLKQSNLHDKDDPKAFECHLDFIEGQIVIEGRASELQQKFNFLPLFIQIIQDQEDKYATSIKTRAAQIVENYIFHPSSSCLSAEEMEVLIRGFVNSLEIDNAPDSDPIDVDDTPASSRPPIGVSKFISQSSRRKSFEAAQQEKREQEKWTKENLVWKKEDAVTFQSSLVRSILISLDKISSNKITQRQDSPVPPTVLNFLLDLCSNEVRCSSEDLASHQKLQVLIIVTLGNLIVNDKISSDDFSDPEILAQRLTKSDAIDDEGCVYLDTDKNPTAGTELTQVSQFVAQILLSFVNSKANAEDKQTSEILRSTTIHLMFQAMESPRCKTTRILCSDCLYRASSSQFYSEEDVNFLRQFTLDPVSDIQIHSTVTFCRALEKLYCKNKDNSSVISSDNLNWLPKIYVQDKLLLDNKDFSVEVNRSILNLMESAAESPRRFSEEIYLLLSFILAKSGAENHNSQQDGGSVNQVLRIISKQIKLNQNAQFSFMSKGPLPQHLIAAIENLFLSDFKLYKETADILKMAIIFFGQVLSDSTLEHVDKNMTSDIAMEEKYQSSLSLIFAANLNQDLSRIIFQNFELHFMTLRIAKIFRASFDSEESGFNHNERLFNSQEYFDLYENSKDKESEDTLRSRISSIFSCIHVYISQGRKVPFLFLDSAGVIFRNDICREKIIKCMTIASENGQSLPLSLVENAFNAYQISLNDDDDDNDDSKLGHCTKIQDQIFSLAAALVQNNQALPLPFLEKISESFIKSATVFEATDQDAKTLTIISTLANNNHSIPNIDEVAHTFCLLWNKSRDNQKGLEVLAAFKGLQSKSSTGQGLLGRVKEIGNFWTRSKSHQHRLDILGALKGLLTSDVAKTKIDLEEIHTVFLDAMADSNLQIVEMGLQGFLLINQDGASYCSDKDFNFLYEIQARPNFNLSPAAKDTILDFLQKHLDKLPEFLQKFLTFLQALAEMDDIQFLDTFQELVTFSQNSNDEKLQQQQVEVMGNGIVMRKFEAILYQEHQHTNKNLTVLEKALEIIQDYPVKSHFSTSIFEAISFVLVNSKDANSMPANFEECCLQILDDAIEEHTPVSKLMVDYLQTNQERFYSILHKIVQYQNPPFISDELKSSLEMRTLLDQLEDGDQSNFSKLITILETAEQSIDLDKIMLQQLLNLKEPTLKTNEHVVKAVAKSVLQINSRDSKLLNKAMEIIQHHLKESPSCSALVFMAYQKLLNQKGDLDVEQCKGVMIVMIKFFRQTLQNKENEKDSNLINHSTQEAILNCILETIKNASYPETEDCDSDDSLTTFVTPFIPFETVELIAQTFSSPDSSQLHSLCFNILRNIPYKAVIGCKSQHQTSALYIPEAEIHALKVFSKIFPEPHEEPLEEMEKNPEFTMDLLQLLYSLKHWDLNSLSMEKNNRQSWREILIISDFISSFAQSKDDEINIALILPQIFKNIGDKAQAEEIIKLVADFLHSTKNDSSSSKPKIIQMLSALSEISYDVAKQILQNSSAVSQNIEFIEQAALNKVLSSKFSCPINPEILLIHTKTLLNGVGAPLFKKLLSGISTIESMENLKGLAQLLIKYQEQMKSTLQKPNTLLEELSASPMPITDVQQKLEVQLLLSLLPSGVKRRKRYDASFTALFDRGLSLESVKDFTELTLQRTKSNDGSLLKFTKIFEHVISQCVQYHVTTDLFRQMAEALKDLKGTRWNPQTCIETCNNILDQYLFNASQSGRKPADNVVAEFFSKNEHAISQLNLPCKSLSDTNSEGTELSKEGCQDFKELILKVGKCEERSKILKNDILIKDWTIKDVQEWASQVQKGASLDPYEVLVETMLVAKQGFHLYTNFHLTSIQILAIFLGLISNTKNPQGLLQQVATGSGKSSIIAILAVIKSLEGKKVDVYTSSPVLAERDAIEWAEFYKMFNLTCDHNIDKSNSYISGPKSCYKSDIVYGDCSQFQFDQLRDSYSDLGTLGGRKCEFAIVDEVDSMFIDDSSKLARLSSTLPGIDLLHIIYHLIWDRTMHIQSHLFTVFGTIYYLEGKTKVVQGQHGTVAVSYAFADPLTDELYTIDNILAHIIATKDPKELEKARIYPLENVQNFTLNHLKSYTSDLITGADSNIKLPKYLKAFALTQILKWVDSAITAVSFQENIHYIVDEGVIKPVDFKTTGVIQSSTNWNNGLHQFLQIKHGLRISSESVTTNFLSNIAMFKKYGCNLIGFTGTLGSEVSRRVLSSVYNVNLFIMPETHHKRYIRFPDKVTSSEETWLQEIKIAALQEVAKKRGVLIIAETIQQAEVIAATLQKSNNVKVKLYIKNSEGQEKQIERIHPGDIFVATNLAGRGSDIKTAEVEKYGGLHVILTFLPDSLRVEEQAFGRTSRQGNKGTGQLIFVDNNQGQLQRSELLTKRDDDEEAALEVFQEKELPLIQIKDNLFENFSTFLQKLRKEIREKDPDRWMYQNVVDAATGRYTPTFYETVFLQSVEERWASFLKKIDEKAESGPLDEDWTSETYKEFEQSLSDDCKSGSLDLLKKGGNIFYLIQLGNHYYEQDGKLNKTLESATSYFEEAIKIEPDFSAAAYVGLAYTLLKGSVNSVWFNSHKDGYKDKALDYLQKSMPLLQNEMAMITVIQTLVQKSAGGIKTSSLITSEIFKQLTEKANLLGTYIKNVEATISIIEKSLRRIYFSGFKNEEQSTEIKVIPNSRIHVEKNRSVPDQKFDDYGLYFHDLTFREDSGVRDQAVNTLENGIEGVRTRMKAALTKTSLNEMWKQSKKFPVSLLCPMANLDDLCSSDEIQTEQNLQIDLEFCNLEIDPGNGDLLFNFKEMKPLQPKSYSLELQGDLKCFGELVKQCVGPLLSKEVKTEIHFEKLKDGCPAKRIQIMKSKDWEELQKKFENSSVSKLEHEEDGNVTLKFLQVTENDIQKIFTAINSSPQSINLTLHNLKKDKETIKSCWTNFLSKFGQNNVRLTNLEDGSAQNVIPALRKLQQEFVVECLNLQLEEADRILENADITQEEIEQGKYEELSQLFSTGRLPLTELRDLQARGISLIVQFNERAFIPWISMTCVIGLASVQAAAGGVLICTGFGANVGMGLITEGMSDLFTVQRIYANRSFSWSDYRTQKAVSLIISAVSMGLDSLIDGAKGAASLAQGAVTEATEQAGQKVLQHGKVINQTMKTAGKNLMSLAMKQVGVVTVETGAKIGLKALGENLSNFCFEQLRDSILHEVEKCVEHKFSSLEFQRILGFYLALEQGHNRGQLTLKVEAMVQNTTNPKNNAWVNAWNSVGGPLCSGILSSPQFLGSTFSIMTQAYGVILGMKEIGAICSKICQEIENSLKVDKPSIALILQKQCGLHKETVEKLQNNPNFKMNPAKDFLPSKFPESLDPDLNQQQCSNVKVDLQKLHKLQSKFSLDDSTISQMMRLVVNYVTTHIIKTANSTLVSPAMSMAAGSIVAKISAELQDRFLINESQNTFEQNENKEKVSRLKEKAASELTDEDRQFLKQYDVKNTFAGQIKYNAKDYMVAWQRRKIVAKSLEKRKPQENPATDSKSTSTPHPVPKEVEKNVTQVLEGAPADMATMMSLAAENDVDTHIVYDPNYKPTPEEVASGIKIVLFETRTGPGEVGRYSLMDNEGKIVPIESSTKDSGYAVMAEITGKDVETLRCERANDMLENPERVREIQTIADWVISRYPCEANSILGVGGMDENRTPPPAENIMVQGTVAAAVLAVQSQIPTPSLLHTEELKDFISTWRLTLGNWFRCFSNILDSGLWLFRNWQLVCVCLLIGFYFFVRIIF